MFNIHPPAKDNILLPVVKALSPDEQAYFDDIISNINKQLKVSKDWLKTDEAKEFFQQRQEEIDKVFKSTELHDKLNEIVNHSADNSEDFIQNFYKVGAALGYEDLDRTLSYTPADKEALYAVSKYNFDLVKDVNDELRGGIKQVIFEGVAAGKGPLSLVPEIEELPLKPIDSRVSVRTRAEMIARTEHARAVNTGTLQAYANYDVKWIDVITAGDRLVCENCLYNEAKSPWAIKEAPYLLPTHPYCRCSYAPNLRLDKIPEQPIEKPPVMDLTKEKKPKETVEKPTEKPIDSSELEQKLNGIVDENDIKTVSEDMLKFKEATKDLRYEKLSAWDNKFKNICDLHTDEIEGSVSVPSNVNQVAAESGLGLTIHNHPYGSSALPSGADIMNGMVRNRTKYGVTSTSGNGFIVMTNRNIEDNAGIFNFTQIDHQVELINNKIQKDFVKSKYGGEYLRKVDDLYSEGKITKEHWRSARNTRFHKYLINNTQKYCKIMDKKLGKFDINVYHIE